MLLVAVVAMALLLPAAARALSPADLPATPPAGRILDGAAVLSRASAGEIERQLEHLVSDHVNARLVTVNRLDYGLTLEAFGAGLLERWRSPESLSTGAADPLLLLLIDGQTRGTAIVADPALSGQLSPELLRSTARTTMALPLREGDRYRQATLDALTRLDTVLEGGEDPGEPEVAEAPVVVSNIPSQEETAASNAFTWVVVLLVVGTVVPMATWWIFSR